MALLDSAFRQMAKSLLTTLGAAATLRRITPGAYSPISGESGNSVTTDYSVKISPPAPFAKEFVNATVLRTDLRASLAAKDLAIVPTPTTDSVLIGGTRYRIIAVESLWSGDQIALYDLQLRL